MFFRKLRQCTYIRLFLVRIAVLNMLLASFIGHYNMRNLIAQMNITEFIYTEAALLSTTALNVFILFLVLVAYSLRSKKMRHIYIVSFVTFGAFQLFMLADAITFHLSGFHAYRLIGANLQILKAGIQAQLNMPLVALLLVASTVTILLVYKINNSQIPLKQTAKLLKWICNKYVTIIALIVWISFVAADKAIYWQATQTDNRTVKRIAYAIPFYQKVLLSKLWSNNNYKKGQLTRIKYPANKLENTSKTNPNIVWIQLEGLSQIERKSNLTPLMDKFAKHSLDFQNHYATADNPRHNSFANYYGLWPCYYKEFVSALSTPILFDELGKRQYDIRAYLAHDTEFSEDKQFLFLGVSRPISFTAKQSKTYIHKQMLAAITRWQVQRDQSIPFAAFVHMNLTNYPVDFNESTARFRPYSKLMNPINNSIDFHKAVRGYKNAVLYQDSILGELLNLFENFAEAENTIIMISSDGKSPFASDPLINSVPLIVKIPKTKPKLIKNHSYSIDIIPTIMHYLGYNNPSSDYANGINLFAKNNKKKLRAQAAFGHFYLLYNNKKYELKNDSLYNSKYLQKQIENKIIVDRFINENTRFLR